MLDRKARKIVRANLILTLYNAYHFFESAKIDTREYVHYTESVEISNHKN